MKRLATSSPRVAGLRDTDRDWQVIGQSNPYWGVLSLDRFKSGLSDAADEAAFYQSGVDYVGLLTDLTTHRFGFLDPKRTLDFGCGVGRILIPLARMSGHVTGVDVSRPMLDLAEAYARDQGLGNVRLVESLDDLSPDERFDLVHSFIVLQHIPQPRGLAFLNRLIDLTALNGVFALHVTFARTTKHLNVEAGDATHFADENGWLRLFGGSRPRRIRPNVRTGLIRRLIADREPAGAIKMYDYDLNDVFARILPRTNESLMALPTNNDGHLGLQIIGRRTK